MKHLTEYRNPELAKKIINEIKTNATKQWHVMEICGGQTHSLVKNGILSVLPDNVQMLHGPGCPVCVTSLHLIDKAIYLAEKKGVILCSFGDMLRVPGSEKSLLEAKAGKLHQDLCGYNKKNKLGLQNPALDDVKKWTEQ
jgi:hydrogenase expression/formation protein HypD